MRNSLASRHVPASSASAALERAPRKIVFRFHVRDVRESGEVKDHSFEIEFLDPGVRAFSFTFG
jgi:hypothetical protein